MNNAQLYRVAAFVAALAVVGCSGGSGSGSGFTSTPSLPTARAKHRSVRALGSSDITEYSIPTKNSSPFGITVGPDGALWFAEHKAGKLGRITTSGTITEPANLTGPAHFPFYVATGSDANLWTTGDNIASLTGIENKHDNAPPLGSVMRVTPTGDVITYMLPTQFSDPRGIVEGPDGSVWFTETRGAIGNITPAGVLTEYTVPGGGRPFVINVGPDGALWFTESANDQIGRITTSGVITTYAFPDGSGPTGVVSGPDGNLWITEYFANKVAQVATSGTILHEYATGARPRNIVVGSDGNLYFTEFGAGKIGQLTVGGVLTEIAIPTPDSAPFGITAGPDGNIWFAESATSNVGKLSI